MNEKYEKEQRLYDAYYQKMMAIENERESIERRKRELDEKEDALQREQQSTYEQEEIIREELRKKKELLDC